MRIGILGGTMDPVHFGHLRSAEEIRENLVLDQVWFVPAARPPHKSEETITPFGHRLQMVKLATAGVEYFRPAAMESERSGPSYSVDTLRILKEKYGTEVHFFFILGSDAFLEIETWKEFHRLTEFASLVIAGRIRHGWENVRQVVSRGFPEHEASCHGDVFTASGKGDIIFQNVTRLEISGTDIRQRVRTGRSARFLVPEAVRQYMKKNSLYIKVAKKKKSSAHGRPASEELAQTIAYEIVENKGEEVTLLDVRGRSSIADFYIIAHGRSTRHVQGIASKMRKNLSRRKIKCRGVEGEQEGTWILIDFDDVVVHLFHEPVRRFYDLEGLWSQAPRTELETDSGR
ncbi:MAG TPA: nicotinate (nicotinamide) nucleotide adenylyltransferase [Thermodesulfobacteriaceae bacterium]|nr:nicotinate (nicotinamide) nucleotide adenylyltransferase [Thermodesulfobacteriaceae bacterium]